MGNFISSCTFVVSHSSGRNSKVSRVIFPNGEIRQFLEPVGAAELMLECSGFFVVDSRSLSIGRRIYALGADEELRFGNVYVMLPGRRVNSIATAGDMAVILMGTRSAGRRISAGGNDRRVSPEADDEELRTSEGGVREGEISRRLDESLVEGLSMPEYVRHRLSSCRSRRPGLETIKEEAVLSR